MKFTLISYYTNDWKYPEYAKLLEKDCSKLGIDSVIKEVSSANDYVKNCNIKPSFIRDQLLELKSPVLWMDVDGSLLKIPDLLLSSQIENHDIAGNFSTDNPQRIHVGSIWFNYNKSILDFIDAWCEKVKYSIDDAAFNGVWMDFKNYLKIFSLPSEYFFIKKTSDAPVPPETIIMHRLSSSDLKWHYKSKVENLDLRKKVVI